MEFVPNPDFLHPIGTKNRDEALLVPFHRVLKNTNMSAIINLTERMAEDPDIQTVFPGLLDFTNASALDMYAYSVMFPEPHLMLQELSDGALSVDTAIQFAEEFMKPLHVNRLHKTRLEIMINQLIRQPFIKKLYIQADRVTMEIADYVMQEILQYIELAQSKCELHLLEGDFMEVFRDTPDITTCFLNTSFQFDEIVDTLGEDGLVDKAFIIMDNKYDYIADTTISKEPIVKHRELDRFKKYLQREICAVSYMYPYPFGTPDEKPEKDANSEQTSDEGTSEQK